MRSIVTVLAELSPNDQIGASHLEFSVKRNERTVEIRVGYAYDYIDFRRALIYHSQVYIGV